MGSVDRRDVAWGLTGALIVLVGRQALVLASVAQLPLALSAGAAVVVGVVTALATAALRPRLAGQGPPDAE